MENSNRIILNYSPRHDLEYMSVAMQNYFRNRLRNELKNLIATEPDFCAALQDESAKEPDFVDQSSAETLRFNHYVYHEHEVHHRHEIEAALQKLDNGSYGYCAATGKPIGVDRLIAAPYAMYCFDVQAERESHQQRKWA